MQISQSNFHPVAKPLLLETLGVSFLAYVLGSGEKEVRDWLAGPENKFGNSQQNAALEQLQIILHISRSESNPSLRQFNLSRIFGAFHEELNNTTVGFIRKIATGEGPLAAGAESVEEILAQLAYDAYPILLLPREDERFPAGSIFSAMESPLRRRFEELLKADEVLSSLFQEEDQFQGSHGTLLRSTGRGGTVQLSLFAGTLIQSGWREARVTSVEMPSVGHHVESTRAQLTVVRNALMGLPAETLARVAFTGVKLLSDGPVNLGWGVLRQANVQDQHLVPHGLAGKVSGVEADGTEVIIDYSGDVVVDFRMSYRVKLGQVSLNGSWPESLRSFDQIERITENVRLGLLLSQDFHRDELATLIPTWQYIHDPLSHGYDMSWNDPRRLRGFLPMRLDDSALRKWGEFAITIEQNRTKYIDVAIRRVLRASVERHDPADVLLDSVIAWENLFGSRHGETTLRISGAIAWLLENDSERRAVLRSELSKLYSMRSSVVHGNQMPSSRELELGSRRALDVAIESLRQLFTTRLDLLTELKTGDDRSIKLLMGS